MKVTFITSENYLEYWDELMWATGYDGDPEDFDFYSLFEGDPDRIKIGEFETVFVGFNNEGEKLVCYMEDFEHETPESLKELLNAFFQDPEEEQREYDFELLDGQGWEAYETEETAIAYRGGKGYVYSLWKPIAQ